MSANNVTFTGAIREAAKGLGRTAADAAVDRLNLIAQTLGEIDAETGAIAIRHAPDRTEPFQDWLRREVGQWPAPMPEKPAQDHGFTGQTAAAVGLVARIRAQDNADALAHAKALAAGPNPFRPGGNLTHRAIITHKLPEVAARLRAQAK